MEKSYLHSVVVIALVTLAALLAMRFLPSVSIGGHEMREVDLVADLRGDEQAAEQLETSPEPVTATRQPVDSCRPGLVCINDFSGLESQGIEPLYRALDSLRSLGRPVRIAVLGDSYIEGDIFTAHLRERMQSRWGGGGVGFVPITDAIAGFRTTVSHKFGGWTAHHANEPGSGYGVKYANITGHYFTAGGGAWLSLTGTTNGVAHLDTCQRSSLYYCGYGSGEAVAIVNGSKQQRFALSGNGSVQAVTVAGNIGSVKWRVTRPGGLVFIGASMDPEQGVVVDNFSLRSSGGTQLKSVSADMFAGFDRARHYDLVVIMYGLNVAGRQNSKFEGYRNTMTQIIDTMKSRMPETGFLLVGSTDREERYAGGYRTLRGVLSLINVQQQMAYDTHIAFWNLYTAMGGQGSVVKMVRNHEANLDYTHINFNGGKRLSGLLFDALDWGYDRWRGEY